MFNDTDNGQTQYCPMCEEWAEKYEKLKAENERLKQALEEVREITKRYYLSDKKLLATGIGINPYGAIIEIQDKINEVLK